MDATLLAQPPPTPRPPLQPTIFAQGPPAPTDFSGATRHRLDDSSWVDVMNGWLGGADELFHELATETHWEAHRRFLFDRWVDEPRLHGHLPELRSELAAVVDLLRHSLSDHYGRTFDGGSLALYRDGDDGVAWHGDSSGRTRSDACVAVLSLGAARRFRIRPAPSKRPEAISPAPPAGRNRRSKSFTLLSGDLLVMGGACQRDWQHAVPKLRAAGPRISLQFRSPGWDGRTRSPRIAAPDGGRASRQTR